MIRALLFTAVVAVAFGAALPTLDGRIVGGKDADIKDFPYQVSIPFYGSRSCSGALIDNMTVITAARCVDSVITLVSIRCESGLKDDGKVVKIGKIIQHPKYNPRKEEYDIAVIRLESECEGAPVRLPTSSDTLIEGDLVNITGWGALTEGGSSPKQLQVVSVPVWSNEKCNDAYDGAITDSMLCAGVEEGGKGGCQGDSGGPLVKDNMLWGVVSWGYGCARPNTPGVNANVQNMLAFVEKAIQELA